MSELIIKVEKLIEEYEDNEFIELNNTTPETYELKEYSLPKGDTTIGRSNSGILNLFSKKDILQHKRKRIITLRGDDTISRTHGIITKKEEMVSYRDCSTHGTYLNVHVDDEKYNPETHLIHNKEIPFNLNDCLYFGHSFKITLCKK